MEIRALLRSAVCALCGLATLIASAASVDTKAYAADCFATDNDGVYDQDGAANGIITVTAASTPAVPPAATAYDCTALDFVVESAGLLIFESDVTTGEVVALEVGDLQIDAGGAIRADAEGCPGVLGADPVSGDGSGPNASNVCVKSATGSGSGGNDFGGAGGGAHGGGGAAGAIGAGGVPYDSATAPARLGGSGGNTGGGGGGPGGTGGGVVSITAQSVTHNGALTANATTGGGSGGRVAGGGAGGSIFITAGSFVGATGVFEARGGDAPGTAGGGGGGRIVVLYDTATFDFDASDFDVAGGVGGAQGDKGTVYLRDGGSSAVRIFHGFTFADVDHEESSWVSDASATNQYCDPLLTVDATPQIRAASISIGGAIDCAPEVTSFAIVQEGVGSGLAILDGASLSVNGALRLETPLSLSVGNGASIANTKRATNLEIVIADGDDQSWDAVTIDGAKEGRVIIDAAIALALTNSTTVTGSPLWPSLNSLEIDATSQIDASEKGCDSSSFSAGNGAGPDDSNVCVQSGSGAGSGGNDFGGAGGGAHGGAGAAGDVGAGGTPYDTAVAPVRLGASGGNTAGGGGGPGGTGGGAVEIAAQSITHDGIIRANGGLGGGSGGRVAGGGAGGAIFLSTPSLTITSGTFEAKGGDAPGTAGGGGGGRIALVYESGTFDADASDFDVAGGVGVRNGDNGTVYVEESTASIVRVFHGFTFEDVDYQASMWISDSSATNQICAPTLASDATPSIKAESITLAGTIDCAPAIESFEVIQAGLSGALEIGADTSISVNGALRLDAETDLNVGDGVSLVNTKLGADLTLEIPDGDDQSWSGVTIDGAREGRVVFDAAIALSLANGTTVSGNPAWPALTALSIDATSAIDADEKGCDSRIEVFGGGSGSAPDCSNVCTQSQKGAGLGGNDFGGAGGGGHGGAGGRGDVGVGGSAYEARKAPRLVGASGGNTAGGGGGGGGAGGGVIEIIVNGTLSNDGVVTARGGLGGGSGGRVAGGGSGGTIIISADEYTCTSGSTFAADGGDGAIGTAGGGGGGRIAVIAAVDSCVSSPLASLDPALVAPGGASGGAGSAGDGTSGSVFTTASPSLCGDPVAPIVVSRSKRAVGRSVTASDALFTLNVAVGSDCCDPCLCDVNGSGDVTATDALAGLNAAVGQPVDLLCPPCF